MATNPFLSPPSSPTSTISSETRSADFITMPDTHKPRSRTANSTSAPGAVASVPTDRTPPKPPTRARSHSQDSVTLAARRIKPPKKGSSMHADIIDRLDYSGVGAAMFHHDGPFDACAPSRNRHRTKAPLLAWSSQAEDPSSPELSPPPQKSNRDPSNPNFAPHPQARPHPRSLGRTSSDFVGTGRLTDALPKKRTDALAEAWGVAEPEPFEEFFAGGGSGRASAASSVRAGKEGHSNHHSIAVRRGRENKSIDTGPERSPLAGRRGTPRAPPPKPIAVPGGDVDYSGIESAVASPKRSRSIMQRIRRMRETPNIPPLPHSDNSDTSPTVATPKVERPMHRSNNSFLGRFSKSPVTPTFDALPVSPFSDKSAISGDDKEKQLPKLPHNRPGDGESYFDRRVSEENEAGLVRRTSLMRKVVNGVKRNAKT